MTPEPKPSTAAKPSGEYLLYLMRHGIAVERGTGGIPDDAKRPLTPDGKKRVREIAEGLLRIGLELDWIVTSPLVRAVETAELVSEALGRNVPMDFCDAMKPGGSAETLVKFLAQHATRRRVMCVGHEPDLGELAARLLGAGRSANLGFKKGGCCLIRFAAFPPKQPGELVWWMTPKIMRKLA
jgi:phosphohistidine phosphatase